MDEILEIQDTQNAEIPVVVDQDSMLAKTLVELLVFPLDSKKVCMMVRKHLSRQVVARMIVRTG